MFGRLFSDMNVWHFVNSFGKLLNLLIRCIYFFGHVVQVFPNKRLKVCNCFLKFFFCCFSGQTNNRIRIKSVIDYLCLLNRCSFICLDSVLNFCCCRKAFPANDSYNNTYNTNACVDPCNPLYNGALPLTNYGVSNMICDYLNIWFLTAFTV